MIDKLKELARELEGELFFDNTMRILYATDASAYRELPLAVAIPRSEKDIARLISFAKKESTSLIPRTAGTSLAGQVVGAGIIVDVSKHFNRVIEVNAKEGWAIVEPGIVRDDLNQILKSTGYFFAPETSTANRAMIGGMIENNSCGSNSIVYGSVREHLLEVDALMADGSQVTFGDIDSATFRARSQKAGLEGQVYRHIAHMLDDPENKKQIAE